MNSSPAVETLNALPVVITTNGNANRNYDEAPVVGRFVSNETNTEIFTPWIARHDREMQLPGPDGTYAWRNGPDGFYE